MMLNLHVPVGNEVIIVFMKSSMYVHTYIMLYIHHTQA